MTLRANLVEVKRGLDEFLKLAGRPNATVIALRDHVAAVAAGDDRALDVEDPRELQRGFDPEDGTIPNPEGGDRIKVAPTRQERADAAAKAAAPAPEAAAPEAEKSTEAPIPPA